MTSATYQSDFRQVAYRCDGSSHAQMSCVRDNDQACPESGLNLGIFTGHGVTMKTCQRVLMTET